eukprot:scaffold29954_cov80-Phaeocystis_antarctica.AAC.3
MATWRRACHRSTRGCAAPTLAAGCHRQTRASRTSTAACACALMTLVRSTTSGALGRNQGQGLCGRAERPKRLIHSTSLGQPEE